MGTATAADVQAELKNLTVDGQVREDKAHFVIQADLKGLGEPREKLIYGTTLEHALRVASDKITHTLALKASVVQGDLREMILTIAGEGEVRQVTGEGIEDWSVRQAPGGGRFVVIRLKKADKPITAFSGQIVAETKLEPATKTITPLSIAPEQPTLLSGFVRVDSTPDLDVQVPNPIGLVPVELKFLPESLRAPASEGAGLLSFRFQGSSYSLPLQLAVADPEARRVILDKFQLAGKLKEDSATFTLTATARVKNPKGGSLDLLYGGVALTEVSAHPDWRLKFERGRFVALFDKSGEFPLEIHFNANVRQTNGWDKIQFNVAPALLQPVVFAGLDPDTRFQFAGAARPERVESEFRSFLPADGAVTLSWKESRPEAEGKLFYSAEALSQVTLSPGLMRQTTLFDFKVMQGELARVVLLLKGEGEVTRVQGQAVLAWNVEPVAGGSNRRLSVQLNQAQKDQFSLQVQMQTPLAAFPQAVDAVQVLPEGATRFGGYLRILNEGAVRLEVLTASGLSQISPDQFPKTEASQALVPPQSTQAFAYRYSGAAFQLRIQADNILPELAVSEVLAYNLAETELAIDAEIELDIREAPLRELVLRVPRGYVIARLNASGLSDHFLTETTDAPDAQLRLVYGSPVAGRQVIQFRLERNKALGESIWVLPRIEVLKAKSVRGHVGVSADAGFRLTPATTQGLTDLATAFFPKQIAGIQAAFRLNDPAWQASMTVERVAQSIQADVLHLFSVGEGIAYGSSLVNYLVSGAPISSFKVELSAEYFNVEFTGKDVRNWQKTDQGYLVQLHTPVSGAYTLLATYERPFKPQGETLTFTGARPLDAQPEQGYTIVVSTYQFQVQPVNLSPSLLALEPGEVPAEFRLLFDAPILAAYRYSARPFNLQLELKPLLQAGTVSQVVDRASLVTRLSGEGQILTDAQYFVKNKGVPNFRITPPAGMQLWSVSVNGAPAVPVTDGGANLIPLPQRSDPNAVNEIKLKLAAKAPNPGRLRLTAPTVSAPVLLTEWKLEPDTGRRLVYERGTLTPVGGVTDVSGFAGMYHLLALENGQRVLGGLGLVLILLVLAGLVWRYTLTEGTCRFSSRHVLGGLLGLVAVVAGVAILVGLFRFATDIHLKTPTGLRFVAPVQQPDTALSLDISNLKGGFSFWAVVWALWPAALAVVAWFYGVGTSREWVRRGAGMLTWLLLCWAALRLPNGAPALFLVLLAFVAIHLVVPSLRRWWRAPAKRPDASDGATAAMILLVLGSGLAATELKAQPAQTPVSSLQRETAMAESITHEIRVEEDFVFGTAKIRWQAAKGQRLPILHAPGVLTKITYPTESIALVQDTAVGGADQFLIADKPGLYEIEVQYQTHASAEKDCHGFALPTQHGLVNRLTLTLVDQEVTVSSPQAVFLERIESPGTTNTVVSLVLAPVNDARITWSPRSRDTRREKAVFYAEFHQLYVPGAGVVEGLHEVQIRPAQGELAEMSFEVPKGSTITDVLTPALSLWRFDPDTRRLRVSLAPPQSKPFALQIKSQIATGPLPFELAAGLLTVNNTAGQIGQVGVATGSEVQLDDVKAEGFSPINIEDFPASVLEPLRPQTPELALRRAFRYADAGGVLRIKASAVEADVRVEAQQTLSLGEDRVVLAANLAVEITRAGIFKLSFVLPTRMDVESVSGPAMSHWTELKTEQGRLITLHLRGKTTGPQQFAISLTGPGVRTAQGWAAPRLLLQDAAKQRGQLVIVPEQGMRLQVTTREGVTQLDPIKAGIRQRGVLAFRLLNSDWKLALDIEQVAAWIQVTSLQHVVVAEAQIKVSANLHFQIENSGVKSLRVRLPAKAESVHFRGEQVSDFLPVEELKTATNQVWEIKLHRRVTGKYLLQATYNLAVPERAATAEIDGVRALDVNLQRGFLTVQAGGRLQVRMDSLPAELQTAEWQAIPRSLQQDSQASSANYTFRLVEADFRLPIRLERHEAAQLLPAHVNKVTLTSVVSDAGVMLTQARIEMVPGDKRLLHITLPAQARFWFAFVNQNSVWPWRENDQFLIPLEQHSRTGEAIAVEFFYTSQPGVGQGRSLDLHLLGPKLDLPLENITWRVSLSDRWRITRSTGSLELQGKGVSGQPLVLDLQTYVRNEASMQKEQTKEAEQYLNFANSLLEKGDPQQARRNFQAAYSLSQGDSAFNEDARVQLHNLKTQQALVGINVRQAKVGGESGAAAAQPRGIREGQTPSYTQQEAKQLLDRNTAEENAVQLRLAERLIQQQDASVANPAAIRATVPSERQELTFTRPLQVDTWADLKIDIRAVPAKTVSTGLKLLFLAGLAVGLILVKWAGRASKS